MSRRIFGGFCALARFASAQDANRTNIQMAVITVLRGYCQDMKDVSFWGKGLPGGWRSRHTLASIIVDTNRHTNNNTEY